MFEKRRYQQRAVEAFLPWLNSSESVGTIILPTGTGKTITAAFCLAEAPGAKILWTAHREELIEQARDALAFVMPHLRIDVEMAERKADPSADIVVGSVQTLARQRKHLDGFNPHIIVIDEYHHYSENNVQYDGLLKRWPQAKLLGLTATPWRFSGEDLPLGQVLIQMDIGTAVEKRYLVKPVAEPLITDVSLADVKTRMGDFALKELSKAVNVESRNKLIADRIIELVRSGRQGILFGVDVEHSMAMHDLLRKEVRVAQVYGETPTEERREIMQRIRNREVDVFCNNLVATEGFDVPHLSFVTVARPTRSLLLYIQMSGRGLRTAADKNDCIILDVFDKIKMRQARITFADMAAAGDLYGDTKRAASILEAEIPADEVSRSLKHFPIFVKREKLDRWQTDEETFSISSWAVAENQWIVTWCWENQVPKTLWRTKRVQLSTISPIGVLGKVAYHDSFGRGNLISIKDGIASVEFPYGNSKKIEISHLMVDEPYKEYSPTETEIKKTDRLFYICMPNPNALGRVISFIMKNNHLIVESDQRLDKWQTDSYLQQEARKDGVLQLIRSNATWKLTPASDKQKDYVRNMAEQKRIGFDLDIDSITKGDASAIIDQAKWQGLVIEKFGSNYKNNLLGYDIASSDV